MVPFSYLQPQIRNYLVYFWGYALGLPNTLVKISPKLFQEMAHVVRQLTHSNVSKHRVVFFSP